MYCPDPLCKAPPKIAWNELNELTSVGLSTGPLTVGPIIAAPLVKGWAVTKD